MSSLGLGFILFCICSSATSTTWVYTAPRALLGLAGSASASASATPTPLTVISDLRRKDSKAAELQQDKDLVGLEPIPEDDHSDETFNEAQPTLLQKKIGKILAKLRLIAQLKNAYHYKPEEHEHESNITLSSEEDKTNITVDLPVANNNTVLMVEPLVSNIQHIPASADEAEPLEDVPVKIDLDIDQFAAKPKNDKLETDNKMGGLGVFFAELVGSIVGLTYGAFAQITAGGQSPVTVGTAEA